jgi:glucosamine-phosphate N-acetyltransferase
VNVDPSYKGKRLGLKMIKILKEIGILNNCYKIVLDCEDHNIEFYKLVS